MISESEYESEYEREYERIFEGLEGRHKDLLKRLIPHSKFNCIGYYKELPNQSALENNEVLSNCDIIEILTDISINVEIFKKIIKWAGYRLLDLNYGPESLQFLIKKVE
jgi:hypothetical protein